MARPDFWWDFIKSRLLYVFPHHWLSRLLFGLTRIRIPLLVRPAIALFIRVFKVDMSEAAQPSPAAYADFNAFFTRALRPDARPVAQEDSAVVSPADGRISQIGHLDGDRLLQAKGQHYTLDELLGDSGPRADALRDGSFCTIYLSPRDYHRVHMPADGTLHEMIYLPGRLFSVAPYATEYIPRLFARNERIAMIFDTAHGPMAVIMVGALNVAALETVWAGLVTPPPGKQVHSFDYSSHYPRVHLRKGEEMGRFNMGSTVIILFASGKASWQAKRLAETPVRMGQSLGHFRAQRQFAGEDQALAQGKVSTSSI